MQQLRERVDRLRGALLLPRPLPCARGDPAKVRPEHRPPVCNIIYFILRVKVKRLLLHPEYKILNLNNIEARKIKPLQAKAASKQHPKPQPNTLLLNYLMFLEVALQPRSLQAKHMPLQQHVHAAQGFMTWQLAFHVQLKCLIIHLPTIARQRLGSCILTTSKPLPERFSVMPTIWISATSKPGADKQTECR